MGRKLADYTGQVFHGIEVISWHSKKNGRNYWSCKCHCGNVFPTLIASLKRGATKSCGCLMRKAVSKANTTHGNTNHYLYPTYKNMLARCFNEKDPRFKKYGGRGITVCDRWLEPDGKGFKNFLEDMGDKPEGCSLDRIDTHSNYSPENCRWVDGSVQSFNQMKDEGSETVRVGIRKDKWGKWRASINYKGQAYHLYYGTSLEEAVKAREAAELKFYGEVYKYNN